MRPASARSHKSHAHGRPGRRALVLGGATLALILPGIVSVTLASHSTTTWKTLSHARVLQQAAPPATFGAKTSVLPTLSSSTEITAADFNRDGAVDIVATATSGTRRVWLYQSNAGNPPTFTQVPITES